MAAHRADMQVIGLIGKHFAKAFADIAVMPKTHGFTQHDIGLGIDGREIKFAFIALVDIGLGHDLKRGSGIFARRARQFESADRGAEQIDRCLFGALRHELSENFVVETGNGQPFGRPRRPENGADVVW